MTRETMKRIRQAKENAALLVRYANPKSKSKPTEEQVLEILYRHIPYRGTVRPIIKSFTVTRFERNRIIRCAYFVVELDNGKHYEISAYEHLTGRTPEQKEEDKTATYPSGLFTIFHDEIKAPGKEQLKKKKEAKTMKEFTMIKQEVTEDSRQTAENRAFYIANGYMKGWAEKRRQQSDNGLKEYSTARRWEQYQAGEISREKAVEYATNRALKALEKTTAAKLAHVDRISAAPDCTFIFVSVDWAGPRLWGYRPRVEVRTNTGRFEGFAGGYGYDKESAAIAEAFNQCDSILKALYILKEKGLQAGQSDKSKSATSGRSNTGICGCGAGYGATPYFEGGVGSFCFWEILKKCGFSVSCHYSKYSSFYSAEKEVA